LSVAARRSVAAERDLLRGIPATRIKLIEKIAAEARERTAGTSIDLRRRFLRAYFRGVGEEDIGQRTPLANARTALHHLEIGYRRAPGKTLVEVFNPGTGGDGIASPHTVVMIVTDDMPFLVDSLGVALSKAGVAIHLLIHPVLWVKRDARGRLLEVVNGPEDGARSESWQLYEVDRQTDADQIATLRARLQSVLTDVRLAVEDWAPMRERMRAISESLKNDPPPLPPEEVAEAHALLDWMEARHFVFLGYRHYRLERGEKQDRLVPDRGSGLGILRSPTGRNGAGDRSRSARGASTVLKGAVREHARARQLLILTKANSTATVHRGTYLDYVGIKTFGSRGEVTGEHRFIGLWTSTAYLSSPHEIPVLRKKVEKVIDHFALDPASHDAKAVLHVLETYPRDELFQADIDDLVRISRGVVNLYERRTVRLLARRDPYHRFYSCLIYVPRDRYNTEVRLAIEQIVAEGFNGTQVESQVQIADSNHARLHVVVRTEPNGRDDVDIDAIERRIADAATTWNDRLRAVLVARQDEASALALANRYRHAFPLAYEEDVDPADAIEDLHDLESLRNEPNALRLNLYRPRQQKPERVHLKLLKLGETVPISDILPMLENFGLRVISERPYELAWPDGGPAWIQDFELESRERTRVDIPRIETPFREAFAATLSGEVENDGFNRLLIAAGLGAREIVAMRAYCKYLLQTGVPFTQASIERTLATNANITQNLVRLFTTLFDPTGGKQAGSRAEKIAGTLRAALEKVTSLDEDRILRSYLNVIQATLRTNFYQRGADGKPKPYVSFKLDPHRIPDLPLPRPKYEIFVYSPRVEGVHLRMGAVARGGLRWSDRRDDFRTEVLGLMKAQNVKNTVIVPVGAKGGFVPKRLPAGPRDAVQAEGIACYQTFIRGLLDVTDNIVNGRVVPPSAVVRRDGDDPYLVVAADKGTASFSDIANAISLEYGFWLGDAFASGGSAGYDHKGMGITARGAWESVKRHFREIGIDTQSDDFTAAGIGDMSGDVFGNGMLRSRHLRLLAAFNHQHIFLDPAADAETGFQERQRLFNLPRSTWDDYDRKKISRGGGVYPRSAKSIPLSPAAQSMLGLQVPSATPNEVIRAILRMPVDLLWNGGIGTYVKASDESNNEVGDRSNDAVRVNGSEVRARVVGEGGNLGFSQRGRVEYALSGGRLNTDFIDNSAGVNTSDVEVNIKILLNPLMQAGKLTQKERDKLLARMTDEVASLVLRNNYLQSQALSTLEMQAVTRLSELQHLIRFLERTGELNRALEFLPTDEELAERRKAGLGLTRPELAVVLAYSKLWLNHHLLKSDVPEDPYLSNELERYFPAPVQERFPRAIQRHRLKREIIATATTNSLVNRMGPTFVSRTQDETGAEPAEIARAYTAAREIFDMRKLWARIEGLDTKVSASLQYEMMYQTSRLLRHTTHWLLAHRRKDLHVDKAVKEFRRGVRELEAEIASVLVGADREKFEQVRKRHIEAGAPAELAARIASLDAHNTSLDIVTLATLFETRVVEVARIYFEVGMRLGLDWLRHQIGQLSVDGPWQAVARTGLRDNALRIHRRLAERVLAQKTGGAAQARVTAWVESLGEELGHWQRTLADMRTAGAADFATLTVGVETVRKLAD
jgi:glutamate dehydrogenase